MAKEFETNFDYGELNKNKDITKAVAEVINQCKNEGVSSDIIKNLEVKFKIKEPKKYNMENSPFLNWINSKGIDVSIQGFVKEGSGDDEIHFPIICINEDIRKMEALMMDLNINASKKCIIMHFFLVLLYLSNNNEVSKK